MTSALPGATSSISLRPRPAAPQRESAVGSEWVVLARRQSDLAFLDGEPRWGALTSDRKISAWTDNFSNIVSVLKW